MNAYNERIFVLSLLSCVFSRTFLSGGIGVPIFSAFSRILPRVYLKSRNYRLFLQAQAALCLTSCLYLRNIRHALCFQIHIKAAASLFYSSTKGRIKPENMPLLSSLPRQRHIPLVCFSPRSYADGCARRHFPVLPAPLQCGTVLHSCAPYIWAGCRFYFPRWQS